MRLAAIREYLDSEGMPYRYAENDDCGSIEMEHRGLRYHVWEYPEPERGAASNVASAGRMTDYEGNYEEQILEILKGWKA